ncbi:MAG: Holliday junction resolvase RuvX [Candidatus Ancaeobacter aquaticus]|nr:Holliday junction resolvase RuvX [Candidatus Ancaeobacter aquaticus]
MRILGLDIGDVRIGVSMSDELLFTAQSLKVITRTSLQSDIQEINKIISEHNVELIVLGMPLNMDGSKGFRAYIVEKFAETFSKFSNIPCEFVDERLTTVIAHRSMLEGNLSRKKRKKRVDAIAAQLILQTYLDIKKTKETTNQEL